MRIVVVVVAALGLALSNACAVARPRVLLVRSADPRLRPVVRVAVDHRQALGGLAAAYDEYVGAAVRALDAGDPARRWELVDALADADVIVRHAPSATGARACTVAGYYELGTRAVYVDPACAPGAIALQSVLLHELMHWAGARHVCLRAGELPANAHAHARCSPVGFGCAVLNPTAGGESAACAAGLTSAELTELDRAELARARP